MRAHQTLAATLPRSACVMLATAATLLVGYRAIFTGFVLYDDEGYLLLSLRSYARGARLYDQMQSQYGPFFYQVGRVAFAALGGHYTHTAGRLLTLVGWVATSLLCGLSTMWMTRRLTVALCVQLLVFATLAVARAEPMHPGGLLSLLLALVVAAVSLPLERHRMLVLACVGAAVGGMVLTKVNIGVFALIALGLVVAFGLSTGSRAGSAASLGLAAIAVLSPFLVMASQLDVSWVRIYAAQVSLSALGLVIALARSRRIPVFRRDVAALGLGLAAMVAVSVGGLLADGTGLTQLVRSTVLDPLRLSSRFSVPLRLPPATLLWSAAMLVLCGFARTLPPGAYASARIGGGLAMWAASLGPRFWWPFAVSFPLVWLAAPGAESRGMLPLGRWLLPALAVLQALHAYPVAGSQLGWGAFLLVPAGGLCIADGLDEYERRLGTAWRLAGRIVRGSLLAGVIYAALYLPATTYWSAYASSAPLGLPGAERVRASPVVVMMYRWLTEEIRSRCTTFFAIPGQSSLYFFTARDPPGMANDDAWGWLELEAATQQRVVEGLDRVPGLCAVRNERLVRFWTKEAGFHGPLEEYVSRNFRTVTQGFGFELLVRNVDATPP